MKTDKLWAVVDGLGHPVVDLGGLGIATVAMNSGNRDKRDSYLRLIAAAPDLLAECRRAQDELATVLRDGQGHLTPEMLRAWFNGVSAAITKATEG